MKKINILICSVAFLLIMGQVYAQAMNNVPAVTGNAKVDKLISQMTFEEKVSMIHGSPEPKETNQGQAGYLPGVPRLGIPSMRLADGPHGLVTRNATTGMVGTIGLAATWSRIDSEQHGDAIGRDARLQGIDIVLEPFVNLWRDINYQRGSNTYGEDPFLSGQIGVGMVKGIQNQNVMVQVKHYVANDANENVYIDEQTLHEVYVAPFAAAAEAGAASMMCAYNKVNGTYICGNCDENARIIRGEMNWKGFMTSDWGATHGTNFINCGEDLEMPGASDDPNAKASGVAGMMSSFFGLNAPKFESTRNVSGAAGGNNEMAAMAAIMGGGTVPEEKVEGSGMNFAAMMAGRANDPAPVGMRNAVESGLVKAENIDKAIGRILSMMDKFGWLEKAPSHTVKSVNYEANVPTLRKTALDAAVLLKNIGDALPLKSEDLESLALIGPGAGQTIATEGGGEMSVGLADKQIGTYQVMKSLAPQAKITYAVANDMTGEAIPASALSYNGKPGLLRTDMKTRATKVDEQLSFTKSKGDALTVGGQYSWEGDLTIPTTGMYDINFQVLGAGGTLMIDGKSVTGTGNTVGNLHGDTLKAGGSNVLPSTDGLANLRNRIDLTAGPHKVKVTVEADLSNDPVQVQLAWVTPEERKANYDAAITAAKNSKKAVVFIWTRGKPFFNGLPGDQEKLLNDIIAVNPNTIVVVNSQHPFAMPWVDRVKAVLNMWYPGDEGGWATANLLLGKASPAGRLPFTWPKKIEDNIGNDPNHPERSAKGVDGKATYTEGLNIGYRYYEIEKKEPMFPFGYGLSYTSFEYSNLKTLKAADGGLDVSFTLKNTGKADSDEVIQVYLDAPKQAPDGVQFAIKALAGFERVTLKAGESRKVTVHVPKRSLEYWSTVDKKWVKATGPRTLGVGASSKDLRLFGEFNL
jgi:beta-glucosidase